MEPYQNKTERPRIYMETNGTGSNITANCTRTGPLRKCSHVNIQNGSHQVRLETRQGESLLTITNDHSMLCS